MLGMSVSRRALTLTAIFALGLTLGLDPTSARAETSSSSSSRPAPTAFVYNGRPPASSLRFAPGQPATKAATELLAMSDEIAKQGTDIEYSHSTKVRRKQGLYHFDCSGMLNWMLKRSSKRALESLGRERPVASTYVKTIAKAPSSRGRKGWQNIVDIEQVEPGDLFAWKRPKNWPRGGATGHVGIVAAKPVAVRHIDNAYLVRIIDSTRYRHQDDTRARGETGFGSGTVLFMTDDRREPIGYAWYGELSGGWYATQVVFGRVH